MVDTIMIITQGLIIIILGAVIANKFADKNKKINEFKYQKERNEELISYYKNKYQDNDPVNVKIIMENGKEINLKEVVNVNQTKEFFYKIRYDNGNIMYVRKDKIQQIDVKGV